MDALQFWLEFGKGEGTEQGISFQIQLLFQDLQQRVAGGGTRVWIESG